MASERTTSLAGEKASRKGSAEKVIAHTRVQDDSMIRDHYAVGAKIGEGNFGKVYEATNKHTGLVWAIKSINKEKAGSSALKLLEREVAILKRVNHPNIINLNEVIESPKRMYLVMEMCKGGELADVLKERKMFNENETKLIIQKLAGAIAYLHKHGIVHRDIKLENILMADNPVDACDHLHVKITDFGLSVVKGGVTHDSMMQDFCGTPIYMAPEILDNKAYSQQCDVWALGIIMYTLLCGYPPFRANEEGALYDLIREAKVEFTDKLWDRVSCEAKNCIQGMLKVDPAHRLSAAEVHNHSWITGEARDSRQPANVLEMMKLWKDELRHDKSDDDDNLDYPASNGTSLEWSPESEKSSKKSSLSHESRHSSAVYSSSIKDSEGASISGMKSRKASFRSTSPSARSEHRDAKAKSPEQKVYSSRCPSASSKSQPASPVKKNVNVVPTTSPASRRRADSTQPVPKASNSLTSVGSSHRNSIQGKKSSPSSRTGKK